MVIALLSAAVGIRLPGGIVAKVVDTLLRGTLERDGSIAVHFAAMLLYIHGLAGEPFDWAHRPFCLRFNMPDEAARRTAHDEPMRRLGRA